LLWWGFRLGVRRAMAHALTFSAVYTKVCSLRSVGQKSKRWSDQEDDIIRKITKEQHQALTSLLNRRNNGGKTLTQLCNINGL